MKSVSIIIPNWNGADLLCAYLPSVVTAAKKFGEKAEVIVVDDASTDASVTLLQEKFPDIKPVVHHRNKGFGKACWSGAQSAKHPVLIFLNSDVEVDPDFIDPLAICFDDETVFAASPLIFDERGKLSDVTISIPYFRRGKIRYKSFSPQPLLNHASSLPSPWYTLFPSGGAFAVDRVRFLELEGFDDLFNPFYYEDTDLGFRAWRRGWKCIVVPESRVTHYHQGAIASSFKKFSVSAIRKRNRLFYLWKNLTSDRLLRNHLLFQVLRLCYRPFCFDAMIVIATCLAIPGFRKAMSRRSMEQVYIVNSEEEIFQIINSAFSTNRLAIEAASSSGFSPAIK